MGFTHLLLTIQLLTKKIFSDNLRNIKGGKMILFITLLLPQVSMLEYICDKDVVCDKDFWQVTTYETNEPVSGFVRKYFENGQIQFEGVFKNGKPEGENIIFYSNGQIEREGSFKNGKFSGVNKWYNQNGTLRFIRDYQEGGKLSEFSYVNGKIYAESNYLNNMKDGLQRKYHLNGQLKWEHNYKNNQLDGIQKEFDSNGKLVSEKKYKDGSELKK